MALDYPSYLELYGCGDCCHHCWSRLYHLFCLWSRRSSPTWIPWCSGWVSPGSWWWWWLSPPWSPPSNSERRQLGGRSRRPELSPPARWRWPRCWSATPSCSSSACRPSVCSSTHDMGVCSHDLFLANFFCDVLVFISRAIIVLQVKRGQTLSGWMGWMCRRWRRLES